MKRLAILFVLIVGLTLAAAPATDVEALLRDGDAAFQRGDCAAAAALYEKAGLRTTEPALVAFNLAVVKYRQALDNPVTRGAGLDEAERYFRCCLAADDPRRGRALHYLGACVLQQAVDGSVRRARTAAEILEECLRQPHLDPTLRAEAEQNLALALLIAAQVPPPSPETSSHTQEEPRGPEPHDDPRSKEHQQGAVTEPNLYGDRTASNSVAGVVGMKPKPETAPAGSENSKARVGRDRTPGGEDVEGKEPAEARFLQAALDRIIRDQHEFKRKKATPPPPGVKDW